MEPRYVVVELQTNTDGVVGNIVNAYDSIAEAEACYHTILAAAALSTLPKHAAIMFSNEGFPLKHECYTHVVESEA